MALMRTLATTTFSALLFACLASPAAAQEVMDDLNGLWTLTLDGQAKGTALSESYYGVRFRILPDGKPVYLVRDGDVLTLDPDAEGNTGIATIVGGGSGGANNAAGSQVKLTIAGLDTKKTSDDKITGNWFGKQAVFIRDTSVKPPIEINMAGGVGDRPWVRFMREVLIPKSAEDRESYHKFDRQAGGAWIKGTELGSKNYWVTKGWIKSPAAFEEVFQLYHGTLNTPRNILSTKLGTVVKERMREDKKGELGLALSQFGMYFSTASGGAVRLIVTSNRDSIVYYITDRRAHERTGLVVNATPTHKPLASSFGKWQNDAGEMTLDDDEPYDRAVLELMVKSNTSSMNQVSGTGRGAFTDYFGIMAIEDQRGVMFGNDGLDWGRNMTEASFIISIIRSLGHGEFRKVPVYRPGPEKTITDEPLAGLKASAEGQLEPSRSIAPKSIRIEAPGLPAVLDDGDGTLYAEGTDPAQDSVGYVEYGDGSYNLSWNGFAAQATVKYKDAGGQAQTRQLKEFSASLSVTLGSGKVEPKSLRIQTGGKDLVDDGDGSLYDEGADPSTADSRGWLDYDDGSLECNWDTAPAPAMTATWKTTDGQQHTLALKPTSSSSGLIDPLGVVPKSVKITAGSGPAVLDNGEGSLFYEGTTTPYRGSIDYASGSFNVRWTGIPAQPITATFKVAGNQTKSFPVKITASASGKLKSGKITPKSIRIRAGGLKDIVDDGQGTLYDQGGNADENSRGYVDYEEGRISLDWDGVPNGGTATVSYKSKAGSIVFTDAKELAMQVIIDGEDGPELRPGTPSYIDICNGAENALEGGHKGGNDCQVGDQYQLEEFTTRWLRAEHKDVIDRLEKALEPFGYDVGSDNLFSAMTNTFYDAEGFSKVTQAQGNGIVEAAMNLFRTIRKDSRKLEAFMLANGVTKSQEWAPRASGF